jgi:hypothetical protein
MPRTQIINCPFIIPKRNHLNNNLIPNLHLDRALGGVRGDVERLDGALEGEAVGDERLEIDEAARDEADGLRVLVGVAVLELEVDLVGGAVAEGVRLLRGADADDEDLAAEVDRLGC